ncbi:MAG: sulfotransferase family protein [Acidimicrobiia bacterium]|nr:MAG: sulfotransferase family protein [Acidimicrobiia bacterium]
MPEDVDVLLIAGSGRSGSTLLDGMLGSVAGVASVGEARYVWERGHCENRLCGCGRPFRECPFWAAVLERAYGGCSYELVAEVLAALRNGTRVRHALAFLAGRRARVERRTAVLRDVLGRLYRAVAEVADARLVVDSSKSPMYGHLVERAHGVRLHVVHLVRDPRATAYSWQRHKPLEAGAPREYMERFGPWRSTALWTVWNLSAARLWSGSSRYRLLRYEDLVRDAPRAVEEVLRFVGHDAPATFVDRRSLVVRPGHRVAGNPDRLRSGLVRIRADEAWQRELPGATRWLIGAVTAPVRRTVAAGAGGREVARHGEAA